METKSFLIEEHASTIFDSGEIERWKEVVEALGLSEQQKLVSGNKSPIPFPVMTELQSTIYSDVLNMKTNYKTFSMEAIPLSVLDIITFAEKENHFDIIEIWYSRNNPDPLVVGKRYPDEESKSKKYTWKMIPYLIAAWGSKLKPAVDLLPAWKELKLSEFKENYENQVRELNRKCTDFDFQASAFELPL